MDGRIKVQPEDFEVEEIPAYPPSGQGDYLYLWLEKRGMGAEYFVRQIGGASTCPSAKSARPDLKTVTPSRAKWHRFPFAPKAGSRNSTATAFAC